MSGPQAPPGQPQQPQQPPVGSQTYQSGDVTGGKRGVIGLRERNWTEDWGGGFLGRQTIPPELMQQMLMNATGQGGPSPAETLARAGLGQLQGQAYGLAAGAQGMNPALAMRGAQQSAQQAGLSMLPQYAAMNADWQQQQQGLLAQTTLQQQQQNDAIAVAKEQMLQQLAMGIRGARDDDDFDWSALAGGALTAAGTVGGAVIGGPGGAAAGKVAGQGLSEWVL